MVLNVLLVLRLQDLDALLAIKILQFMSVLLVQEAHSKMEAVYLILYPNHLLSI